MNEIEGDKTNKKEG